MGDNSLMTKRFVPQFVSLDAFRDHASKLLSSKAWRACSDILRRRWTGVAILSGVLLISLLFLGYGIWLLQLERGARAVAHGELDTAADLYASAERPFHSVLSRLFPDHYSRTIFPQVALLYNRGKTNEAAGQLERAAARSPALSERAEYAFWSGNILLRRALENTDPDVVLKNLYSTVAHFRKALEASPADWDIKYNYELVQYILAEQEREKEKDQAKMKTILDRIRTITEPAPKEPPPPEKRG